MDGQYCSCASLLPILRGPNHSLSSCFRADPELETLSRNPPNSADLLRLSAPRQARFDLLDGFQLDS